MCRMLLDGDVFYRIQGGVVYFEAVSGEKNISMCMPIADFRRSISEGQKILREWDAEFARAAKTLASHEPPRLRTVP